MPRETETVVLITGASSGIGAALARRLAAPGVSLLLHARQSRDALEDVAGEARAKGARTATALGELAEGEVAGHLVDAARDAFGRLDHLVANAGFPIFKSLEEMGEADVDYAFRGNVMSFLALAQAARPLLVESPCGRIVAVGSFTAHLFRTDLPQFPASAASKGALVTAVRSLALALAAHKVTVNCVVPGLIAKDSATSDNLSEAKLAEAVQRVPLARLGQPDDVAAVIAFLLSEEAGYVTGQAIHVNGGLV